MKSRRQSREIAVQILYQMEFNPSLTTEQGLRTFSSHFESEKSDYDYARILIDGINSQRSQIDELIQNNSKNWKLERISNVDRNILRLSIYEMLNLKDEVPVKSSINEAIEIAKKYSTEESSRFVNGILDQISKSI